MASRDNNNNNNNNNIWAVSSSYLVPFLASNGFAVVMSRALFACVVADVVVVAIGAFVVSLCGCSHPT